MRKPNKLLPAALLLVHIASAAFAQSNVSSGYRVYGRVYPAENQTPAVPVAGIPGAPPAARGNMARLGGVTELGVSVGRQAFIAGDGTFEFHDVPPGFYAVELTPSMSIAPADVMVRDRDVGLNLGRPWIRVSGAATLEGGGPVPPFEIEFATVTTAAEASQIERRFAVQAGEQFSVDMPAGLYRVKARGLPTAFQLASDTQTFRVDTGAKIRLVLRTSVPAPWVTVAGRVEDGSAAGIGGPGAPKEARKITLTGPAAATPIVAVVNPDGSFEFPKVLPGRYETRVISLTPAAARTVNVGASGVKDLRIVIPALKDAVGEFVPIEPGVFIMGCPPTARQCNETEKPAHRVGITRAFEIGKYEVTQAQWEAAMGTNPSAFKGPTRPVDNVVWQDAQEFIARLNTLGDSYRYRLPTEAEWEYAARAGDAGPEPGVADSDRFGWFNTNAGGETHPVGQKAPNAWGLYDMRGNVDEWVADWYDESYYANSPGLDPAGPAPGQQRIVRGGQFSFQPDASRATSRILAAANSSHGLRLVREPLR
jgi:formylglycine-generating enzyme required for sulfatase activity